MSRLQFFLVFVTAVFSAVSGSDPAWSEIKSQQPCVSTVSPGCMTFGPSGSIPTVRTLKYDAVERGSAKVTFHGTLYCWNASANVGRIDLISQIVVGKAGPSAGGPGSLVHSVMLEPGNTSQTFNLHSTRVVPYAAAASKTFRFSMARRVMSAGTQCVVYNAAFTVQFARESGDTRIVGQASCREAPSQKAAPVCPAIGPSGNIPPIRTLEFEAPSDGRAEVTFHGSIYCENVNPRRSFIDLVHQIYVGKHRPAAENGMGGNKSVLLLQKGTPHRFASASLAGNRVVDVKKGKITFGLAISRQSLSASATCKVRNAALTVHFVPNNSNVALIVSQRPCVKIASWCDQYLAEREVTNPARRIAFDAPSSGYAVVSVNGAFGCQDSQAKQTSVYDYVAQIRKNPGAADLNAAGGMRMADVLGKPIARGPDVGVTSIAATATYYVPRSGRQNFYLAIGRLRQDADTLCFLGNAAMSINFEADE